MSAAMASRCVASGFGGRLPVVGPHSTRMLRPLIASGDSPWPGFLPDFHFLALASALVELYSLMISGQPSYVATMSRSGSLPALPVPAVFATRSRPACWSSR